MSHEAPTLQQLSTIFGDVDVYLFDQFLKGRFRPGMKVLDAGCGGGRNLHYLLQSGVDCWGVDQSPEAVRAIRERATSLGRGKEAEECFVVAAVEAMPFADGFFDAIICNAVLHFAEGDKHFNAMVAELARVLRPGGLFFARLMSTMGIEDKVKAVGDGVFELPGGEQLYLVSQEQLLAVTSDVFSGELLEHLKSVNVANRRSMATWVIAKGF